jgi:hypothetical protein
MDYAAIISILCVFIAAPAIVFGFILLSKRGKNRIEELKCQRDILALEIEKDKSRIALLEAENRKYDRLIAEGEGLGR